MDPARQLDVWHFLQFFILLFFFLHVLVLLGPTEKCTPCLMVSDLQLAKHIVIGHLQNMSTQCDKCGKYFHPQNPLKTGLLGTTSLHQEPFHLCLALHSSSSFSLLEVVLLALLFLFSCARKMFYSKLVLFYVTLKSFRRTMLIERKPC